MVKGVEMMHGESSLVVAGLSEDLDRAEHRQSM
jgi:hypothetical protein